MLHQLLNNVVHVILQRLRQPELLLELRQLDFDIRLFHADLPDHLLLPHNQLGRGRVAREVASECAAR